MMFRLDQVLPIIPGRLAMPIMLALLLLLMRRHRTLRGRRWLVPLFCLLLSELGWAAEYVTHGDTTPWYFSHLFVLTGQLLAAMTLAAPRSQRQNKDIQWRYFVNAAGPLIFVSAYSFYSTSRVPYIAAACVFLATLLITSSRYLITSRRYRVVAIFAALVMMGALALVLRHDDRLATYWLVATAFLFALIRVKPTLPRESVGKYAVLGSIAAWTVIFALHPFIFHHPVWNSSLNNLWDLQSAFFCIGVLFLLLEKQLSATRSMALHDQLTGLPNRRLLDEHIESQLILASSQRSTVTVLLLDLDGFKKINDTLGHPAGDAVLVEFARRLRSVARETETLARLGGDEFILVSTRIPKEIETLYREIQNTLSLPITIGENEVAVSASIGHATFPQDCQGYEASRSASALLHVADQRMYEQKTALYAH